MKTYKIEIACDHEGGREFIDFLKSCGHDAKIGTSTGNYVNGEGIHYDIKAHKILTKLWEDFCWRDVKKIASAMGKKGGSSKSKAKREASKKNGANWEKPHFKKCRFFEENFNHELKNNEWKVKFNMEINGKKTTYNPDYFCEELDCFIEVATSKPNISEQGTKWRMAIKNGEKLRVFWWEGNEITEQFK